MVGAAGFEPATFWSRTKRATSLRYTPIGVWTKKIRPIEAPGKDTVS